MKDYIFTSESITEGHPDKICDRIADSILDEALRQDPTSKMAVEATIKDDFVLVYGEANTKAVIDYAKIAKDTIREIGYTEEYEVLVKVREQSSEINQAVVQEDGEIGAGDQGIMFGYACDDTDNYMPAAIEYAHKLAKRLSEVRRNSSILLPDGKTQVSVEYENDKIKRIDTIVVSTQHVASATQQEIADLVMKEVITPVIPDELLDENTIYLINPSGSFVVGGSFGDSGTTGRKIVVDSYGGMGRIGGGCFSSKDPSKVDRSAAYYCRYVAKNIVAHNLARKCEIEVAYAIGKVKPVSIMIDTFGTGTRSDEEILEIVRNNFSFEVKDIINELDLCKPIYKETSCYGHFGREEFSWEKIKDLKY
ncbi:MAG: methionine adenosyltransferase [Clostridium sp.]